MNMSDDRGNETTAQRFHLADDTRMAAVTLALAAATNSDMQFHDVIDSIKCCEIAGPVVAQRLGARTANSG
jgi:hypothetical protein